MKCPNCGHNQQYKSGMTCAMCERRFVLDPKKTQLTDGKMEATARKASQNGTRCFTPEQLYATYARSKIVPAWVRWVLTIIGVLILLAGVGLGGLMLILPVLWFLPMVFVVAGLVVVGLGFTLKDNAIKRERFFELVDKYLSQTAKPGEPWQHYITEPSLHNPPPNWPEPDVYDYGVERILIVQRDELVDLLVCNNVHAEQRCLIVSANGYPDYLNAKAAELVQENPELPIFLLHDATPAGVLLGQRIQQSPPFPIKDHPVTDLGLSQQDAQQMPSLRKLPNTKPEQARVDNLPVGSLVAGLGAAMVAGVGLSMLMEQQGAGGDGGGGGDVDFG